MSSANSSLRKRPGRALFAERHFSRSCRFAAGRSGHGSAKWPSLTKDRGAPYLRSLWSGLAFHSDDHLLATGTDLNAPGVLRDGPVQKIATNPPVLARFPWRTPR